MTRLAPRFRARRASATIFAVEMRLTDQGWGSGTPFVLYV